MVKRSKNYAEQQWAERHYKRALREIRISHKAWQKRPSPWKKAR